jgi:predicted MFS family arabinose efflux permease
MNHAAVDRPERTLNRKDAKTLSLAALGGALEFYDFIIYVFFAAVIGRVFFPPDTADWLRQLQTYGIFAAGYLARPLGGTIMGHFGDRFGRKRMFTLSVFMMAVPTLGIGLLPTYTTAGVLAPFALLLMRVLQGAAVGGEVPGAWVFVAEHVPPRRIGFACGLLSAGLTLGILLGSLVATAINHHYSPESVRQYAWRFPFLIGGVFGFVAVFLRRWLEETPVFEDMRRRRALVQELPLRVVLQAHLSGVVLSILASWVLTAAIVVVILMTPSLMQTLHHLQPAQTLAASNLANLCFMLGCIGAGLLADSLGAGRVFSAGCLCLLVSTYSLYMGVGADPSRIYALHSVAGLFVGIAGVVPTLMVRSFPAAVRFTGLSFSYNVAYALFGGLTPPFVALLTKASALGPAHYVGAICLLGCAIGWYVNRTEFSQKSVIRTA